MTYYIINFIPAKGAIPDFRGYLGEIQLVETCETADEAVELAEKRAEINYENSYAVIRKGQITPFFSRAQCCKMASEEPAAVIEEESAGNFQDSFEKTLLENTIVEQIMANSAYAMSVEENITTLRNLLEDIRSGESSSRPVCEEVKHSRENSETDYSPETSRETPTMEKFTSQKKQTVPRRRKISSDQSEEGDSP